jgi:hypothetical protein
LTKYASLKVSNSTELKIVDIWTREVSERRDEMSEGMALPTAYSGLDRHRHIAAINKTALQVRDDNIDDEVMMLAEIFILRLEMAKRHREEETAKRRLGDFVTRRNSAFIPFRPDAIRPVRDRPLLRSYKTATGSDD